MEPTMGEIVFYIVAIIVLLILIAIHEGKKYPLGKVEWVEELSKNNDRWR